MAHDEDDDREMIHAAPPGDDDDDDGDYGDEDEDEGDEDEDEGEEEEEEGEDEEEEDEEEEEGEEEGEEEEGGEDEDEQEDEQEGEGDIYGSRDEYPDADDEDFEDDQGDWSDDDYRESAEAFFGGNEAFGQTAHDRYVEEGYTVFSQNDAYRNHMAQWAPIAARNVTFYEYGGRVVPRGVVRADVLSLLLQIFPGLDTSELDVTVPRPNTNAEPGELPPALANIDPRDKVDLRKYCTPVGDQGQTSRCGAFAYTHAVEMSHAIAGRPVERLSCSYTMLLTQRQQGDARDYRWAHKGGNGTSGNVEPGYELATKGTCRQALWPDDHPEPRADERSMAQDALNFRLDADFALVKLDDLRKVLTAGCPVWFWMNTGDKFSDIGKDGVYDAAESPSGDHGCHAMLMVGYVGNYFIVKNSWGEDWGDRGYCYIPKKVLASADPGFVGIFLKRPAGSDAQQTAQTTQSTQTAPAARRCRFCGGNAPSGGSCPSCGAPP